VANIFVSYTSSDRDWAFWIGQELEKLGHVGHVHEWEVSGGANIAARMEERHDNADHILCVISKVYLNKPYSSLERQAAQWAAASNRPNFALPVFIEECEPPTMLALFKRCDLHGLSEADARARLAAYLAPAAKPAGQFSSRPRRRRRKRPHRGRQFHFPAASWRCRTSRSASLAISSAAMTNSPRSTPR
jgi:hypothetical protein